MHFVKVPFNWKKTNILMLSLILINTFYIYIHTSILSESYSHTSSNVLWIIRMISWTVNQRTVEDRNLSFAFFRAHLLNCSLNFDSIISFYRFWIDSFLSSIKMMQGSYGWEEKRELYVICLHQPSSIIYKWYQYALLTIYFQIWY